MGSGSIGPPFLTSELNGGEKTPEGMQFTLDNIYDSHGCYSHAQFLYVTWILSPNLFFFFTYMSKIYLLY
jgi:hypothetical protein